MDLPPTGKWTVVVDGALPHNQISRADVASFMLQNLVDKTYYRQIPCISWLNA
jgi:hypothetical protein